MNIHNHISKRRVIASGLAVAAVTGVIAGTAFFGGGSGTPAIAADQTQSAPAVENAALHQALGHGRTGDKGRNCCDAEASDQGGHGRHDVAG